MQRTITPLVLAVTVTGSAFLLLEGPTSLRAQTAPARIPFTFSAFAPPNSPSPVPMATVPVGYVVRVTAYTAFEAGPGGVDPDGRLVEVGSNTFRWGLTVPSVGVSVALPEPGVVYFGGETVGVGAPVPSVAVGHGASPVGSSVSSSPAGLTRRSPFGECACE